jgi:hypothetical protein
MTAADRYYHEALERRFRALVGLRPPAGLIAYRLVLLALREPLPAGITDEAERY